jgi:lipopolysaccharide transport protein LptA
MAGALTFADRGRIAHYTDRVRIWQGENRLEGGAVDLLEAEGRLEASNDVVSTFRQTSSTQTATPAGPTADIVTVAAGTMRYQRSEGRVTYAGGVLLTQGPMRVTSDTLFVTLEEGGSGADSLQAEGRVEFRDPGRVGRGDRLFVDFGPDTIRLTGSSREATVQDEAGQQVVRGQSLTMERASDRILVESELGGRTWILLKPRQKGAPSLGSNPAN